MNNTFLLLLKKDMTDNRKTILLTIGGILGIFILIGIFTGMMVGLGIFFEVPAFAFISGLAFSIAASFAFSSMKTKEGRISDLMLPASRFEKFFISWLAVVPGMLIIVAVAWLLGDLARFIVESLMGETVPKWMIEEGLNSADITSGELERIKKFYMSDFLYLALSNFLITQACYFFGAILWPKLSFIKTLAAMQVIQIAIFIFLLILEIVFGEFINLDWILSLGYTGLWIGTAVITIGIYSLAYWRYSRSEVVYKLF